MKLYKLFALLIVSVMMLAACAPVTPAPATQTPAPQVPAETQVPAGALNAQQMLAEQLGVSIDQIQIREITEVEWPDGCLGLGGPAESCLAATVPGFRVVLAANDQLYTFRTDREGTQVRMEPVEEPSSGGPVPGAVLSAQQMLADQLGIPTEEIQVREVSEVEWPDGCLGLGGPAESCLMAIVPGYRVVLAVNDQLYTFRTDQEGSQVRMEPVEEPSTGAPLPVDESSLPGAVLSARQVLAQQLGANLDQITIVSVEAVDWPNSCLGVSQQGQMCAEVITPGYRVTFEVDSKQYQFHTDEEGGAVVMALAPLPRMGETILVWEQTEDGACSRVEVSRASAAFGPCGETMMEGQLFPERQEELLTLVSTYAPFAGETPAGTVDFSGEGNQEASAAEQRSIAEWARLVYQEAESGRSGASWGMVFAWHQEGGIAGLCSDVTLYSTGWYFVTDCRGGQPQDLGHFRLNAEQLAQVYEWVDGYQGFEYEFTDPAVADAMTTRMVFSGAGDEAAGPEQQQELLQFAARLYADAAQ